MNSLVSPLDGLRLCPNLTALDLHLWPRAPALERLGDGVLLSSLPLLRSLCTLRLSGLMHAVESSSLLLQSVLCLPLTYLDLRSLLLPLALPPPNPFPPLAPLRTLLFPRLCRHPYVRQVSPSLGTQWQQALLSAVVCQQEQKGVEVKLERLLLLNIDVENLSYLPLLRHLHTLQLSLPFMTAEREIADLYTALVASPLPLRHVQVEHWMRGPGRTGDLWSTLMLSALQALISAYAGQLLTLVLLLHRGDDEEDATDLPPVSQAVAEANLAALLSCHSLRRLEMTDWWLSSTAPTSASAACAFPHLEALDINMGGPANEAMLAVFLDAAPHLQELTFRACPMPWNIVPQLGSCHELRTLVLRTWWNKRTPKVDFSSLTLERWQRLPPSPALPWLTTLSFDIGPPLGGDFALRERFLTAVVSYLVHSAPALRYLSLPDMSCEDEYRGPLSLLRNLTELRGFSVPYDVADKSWMHSGLLARYWMEAVEDVEKKGSRLQRSHGGVARALWGEDARWPRYTWRELDEVELMRGGALEETEVLDWLVKLECRMSMFVEEVDGMRGVDAFCAALKPTPVVSSVASRVRTHPRRGREAVDWAEDNIKEEEEDGKKRSRVL